MNSKNLCRSRLKKLTINRVEIGIPPSNNNIIIAHGTYKLNYQLTQKCLTLFFLTQVSAETIKTSVTGE